MARVQTSGRGRWKRRWESGPGGLYLSVLLRPEASHSTSLLPLVVSISVVEAVLELVDVELSLRWPNDLYLDDRKLGGILCEGSFKGARPELFVAGIGVNVHQRIEDFPAEVASRAISLEGGSVEVIELAARVVRRLEKWWDDDDPTRVLARWRELGDGASGQTIRVHPRLGESFGATTRGLADDGGLVVSLDDGTRSILYSEDVLYVREE